MYVGLGCAMGAMKRSTDLESAWATAAADAEIGSIDVLLCPRVARDDANPAMHYPPGLWPHSWDDTFVYKAGDSKLLHDARDRHVVLVDDRLPRRILVLLLRHEAEHVAQFEASAEAAEFALRLSNGLPPESGWRWFHGAMPHERDADAAAARLARDLELEPTDDELLGKHRSLFIVPWPSPDPLNLPLRLLAFSLFFPQDFERGCARNHPCPAVDPDVVANAMIPGAAGARRALRGKFDDLIDQAIDHGYSEQEWRSMPMRKRLEITDEIRLRVVEAEGAIIAELREILPAP